MASMMCDVQQGLNLQRTPGGILWGHEISRWTDNKAGEN